MSNGQPVSESAGQWRTSCWRVFGHVGAFVLLAALFGPSLGSHFKNTFDPQLINHDSRQFMPPFMRAWGGVLQEEDFIEHYYLDVMPVGYKLLFSTWSTNWDPRSLSNGLTYLLLAALLLTLWWTSRVLGGAAAGWATVAMCLSTSFFLGGVTGGLPRAFGLVFTGIVMLTLALGRPVFLAMTICLSAAFYPVVSVISGPALAVWLIVMPKADRGTAQNWSLARRCCLILTTALLSIVLTVPMMMKHRDYGTQIRPSQAVEYPEWGTCGHCTQMYQTPSKGFVAEASTIIGKTVFGRGESKPWPVITKWLRGDRKLLPPLMMLVVVVGCVGAFVLARQSSSARRLLSLLLVAVVIHPIAVSVIPSLHMPERYVSFTVPFLLVTWLPSGMGVLGTWLASKPYETRMRTATCLVGCAVCVFGFGQRGYERAGLKPISADAPIYEYLAELPSDSFIAGWPVGLIEDVPLLCNRRILISRQTHQVFFRDYLMEMRRRMEALIDAYYAVDNAARIKLRNDFGVTHLVLDDRHFVRPPLYCEPFNLHTRTAFEAFRRARYTQTERYERIVFRHSSLYVIDLSDVGSN